MTLSGADPLKLLKFSKNALLAALTDAGAIVNHNDLNHCCCFLHAEKNGSLSANKTRHGIWLWKCHKCDISGSIIDVLVHADGLDVSSAIHEALDRYGHLAEEELQNNAPQQCVIVPALPETQSPPVKLYRVEHAPYPTLDAAISDLVFRIRVGVTRKDFYHSADGVELMVVVRFGHGSEKTFRPIHKVEGGWKLGDPPGLLPLFNLGGIVNKPNAEVVIVEGEKCAQQLIDMDYVATTSAHGANSARKTDWSPLAGRSVTIWPDNDSAGTKYAAEVIAVLSGLLPPAKIKLIDPKKLSITLPDGGDVVDFLEIKDERRN